MDLTDLTSGDEHDNQAKRVKLEEEDETVAAAESPKTTPPRVRDSIAKIQDSFVMLGDTYVAALRQCFQGTLGPEEEDVDGKAVDAAIARVLACVELLPDTKGQDAAFAALVDKDAELNLELAQLRAQADVAVKRVRQVRLAVAQRVLL